MATYGGMSKKPVTVSTSTFIFKVQRPGIEPIIYRDLFLFRTLASFLNGINIQKLGCNAELIVDEFGEKLLEELDYTLLLIASVGCAVYIPQVHLWDKTTGKLANLETSFSFVVDYYSAGFEIHIDGLSFFIIPFDADPSIPKNSSGGYLGLFSPETTFNAYKSQIVATALEMNGIPNLIRYYADVKELSVVVGYFNTQPATIVRVLQSIDLRAVLPESVRIGFSGATGDKVETHDILSWSFNSRI
ncbi:lectin 10 [Glycine max]|uniref:lectin 10 n=1 Tax=Glycine max TaxID=3847 RepID=UPI0007192914|nr:lectin 10 [Glycine max]